MKVFTNRAWIDRVLEVYWITLFVGTHIPLGWLPEGPPTSDKLIHWIAYAILAGLFSYSQSLRINNRRSIFVRTLLWMALYAAGDEITQIPVGRFAEWGDWFANLGGSLCGAFFVAVLLPRIRLHKSV